MAALLLNLIYGSLLLFAAPWLCYRRWVQRKPVAGLREKLVGRIERRFPEQPCFWIHAVSVGEVLQLQGLIPALQAGHPTAELLLTVTTGTGYDVARAKFPQCTVAYFPLDFSWSVRRALRSVRPDLIVLVELELWPNFLLAARSLGIPVALINARMSPRSFRGYQRLRPLVSRLLGGLSLVGAQTPEYGERLIALGGSPDRVRVTGNIKFDRVELRRDNPRTLELAKAFGLKPGERVFIAGSTQETEEELAVETWLGLRFQFPELRLILVPRHKERFEDVARLVTDRGLPLFRRSQPAATISGQPVLLLDTLGELGACWGLADVAFVGGSLTQRGGQNMLEPAAYGAAVLFGPNIWNFKDIVAELLARDAAEVVRDGAELTAAVRRLLSEPDLATGRARRAREFVEMQQGATQRTVELLEAVWPGESAPRRAA